MSAYIVDNETINTIVNGFREGKIDLHNYKIAGDSQGCEHIAWNRSQMIGQALLDQNYASVNYRYDEDTTPGRFEFTKESGHVNLKELHEAIREYNYQACETPNYNQSGIKHALDRLNSWMTGRLLKMVYDE